MRARLVVPVLAAAATLGAVPAAYAAPAPAAITRDASAAQAKSVDAAWLKSAAQTDLGEIAAGKLALSKATTAGTAGLGAMFVKDHSAHLTMLKTLAAARGVTLPMAPKPADVAATEKLAAAPAGLGWDRNWLRFQLSGHRAALIATGKARQVSRDSAILDFERKTLKVVSMHHTDIAAVLLVIAPRAAVPAS